MGGEQQGSPPSLTGALAELPEWAGKLIDGVVGRVDPQLAGRLRADRALSIEDQDRTVEHLFDEFSREVHEPDWEPSDYGKRIDSAIGQLFLRFPTDRR